jgi:hypothetical protein
MYDDSLSKLNEADALRAGAPPRRHLPVRPVEGDARDE